MEPSAVRLLLYSIRLSLSVTTDKTALGRSSRPYSHKISLLLHRISLPATTPQISRELLPQAGSKMGSSEDSERGGRFELLPQEDGERDSSAVAGCSSYLSQRMRSRMRCIQGDSHYPDALCLTGQARPYRGVMSIVTTNPEGDMLDFEWLVQHCCMCA